MIELLNGIQQAPDGVTSFVIKRSEWLRGEGASISFLLRPGDSKRCCVGIYARACGVRDEKLIALQWPSGDHQRKDWEWTLPLEHPFFNHRLDTDAGEVLSRTNDSREILEPHRELIITQIFAKMGVTVTFED